MDYEAIEQSLIARTKTLYQDYAAKDRLGSSSPRSGVMVLLLLFGSTRSKATPGTLASPNTRAA